VRDVKSSEAEADDEFPKFCHKAVSQDSIKRAHGFVKKKHPWRWRKRSSERNALSLSPGQRGHIARTEISETDKFKDFGHSNRTFSLGDFRHPQPEGHIVRDAEMRKQCMLLEHQADPPQVRRGRCDVDAVENDRSRRGAMEPRNDTKQCGFPRTGRTEYSDDLASRDIKRDVVNSVVIASAMARTHMFQHKEGIAHFRIPKRWQVENGR
jgi:hypothetical protein